MHPFRNLLAALPPSLPPSTYTMLKLGKKFWMQTSSVVCGVGGKRGGVGQVWIDKKTHKCKCVSRLLSMIAVTGRLQFLSTFEMINRYPNPRVHLNCNLQLFREKLSEKVHATILKGIVGCFEFTILQKKKEIWNNDTRGHGRMLASA